MVYFHIYNVIIMTTATEFIFCLCIFHVDYSPFIVYQHIIFAQHSLVVYSIKYKDELSICQCWGNSKCLENIESAQNNISTVLPAGT